MHDATFHPGCPRWFENCEQGEGWAFKSLPIDDEERIEEGYINQGVLINLVWCQGRKMRGGLGLAEVGRDAKAEKRGRRRGELWALQSLPTGDEEDV